MLAYTAPKATVQQVLKSYPAAVDDLGCIQVQKVVKRLMTCRTPALGYHLYKCSEEGCGHIKYQYHSCRDRHCPQCGALKKQEWIEARTRELLPVKYYHVVFTVPHELNTLVLGHRRLLFQLLFDAASQTLLSFAKDPTYLGALPGIIAVLHSWGQQLSFHPHVHCIVSGGGISKEGTWKAARKSTYDFLFPVAAMQTVYRAKFLEALNEMIRTGQVSMPEGSHSKELLDLLYGKDWVVYAKAPFAGPQAVIEYLGRYTHKVAISNHRIGSINEDDSVTFQYKDYADEGKQKLMTLQAQEFIRRFSQHILPKGFTKIRTYGYLANRGRQGRINAVLKTMQLPLHKGLVIVPLPLQVLGCFGVDIRECPCCRNKTMQLVMVYYPRRGVDDS
ncbi:MAG: IS91 family transposase [Bacteroidota bacterium]|nr:IS91 family transposase [Bacteroidota bacterium]